MEKVTLESSTPISVSQILNLVWTIAGKTIAILSGIQSVSSESKPRATIFRVRNMSLIEKMIGARWVRWFAMGNSVILWPWEEEWDLKHELVHVEQFEKYPLVFPLLYRYQQWKKGYRENPFEVEAYDRAGNIYRGWWKN